MSAIIRAEGLTKKYSNGVLALNDLNLEVEPGEIYCLLGGNGAGKTTALGLFFDFYKPTAGRALLKNIEVAKEPLEAKKHAAFLAENVLLYRNLTALQHLDFFSRISGRRGLGDSNHRQLLSAVGIGAEAMERRVKTFSKGMRQKLGIAIALTKGSDALILDEPTSGLDPQAGAEFIAILLGLRDQGKAILMSTHDLLRVDEIASRVGIMKEGCLVRELSGETLAKDPKSLYDEYLKSVTLSDDAPPLDTSPV